MMLLPLSEVTFNPEAMLLAAASSVADASEGGNNRLRPSAWTIWLNQSWDGGSNRWGPSDWATCTARSQLVRISISALITLSASVPVAAPALSAWGSTPLLSKTYRTNNLACDS